MANSPQVYDAAAIAALNALTATANSGYLAIYTGTQPGVDGALTGTLLVSLPLSATAFQTATASGSGASATANAATPADAVATGTAGYFAILKSDGTTVVATGSVGTSGADLNLNSVSVEIGTNMSISSFTITQPQSLAMAKFVWTQTAAGTYTWVSPVTGTVRVQCWAGGGGGGGSISNSGSGGGGGEYAEEPALSVVAGTAYTVVVGAPGAGVANGTGGNGANSTFATTSVVAHGGGGGAANGGAAGAGGTGSANTTHHDGGAGGLGAAVSTAAGGGGGSSGGTASAGNAGGAHADPNGGAAGAAVSGGGIGAVGTNTDLGAGLAPVSGPGGGGGGSAGSGVSVAGGAGWAGQVIITAEMNSPAVISAADSAWTFVCPPGVTTVTAEAWGSGAGGFQTGTSGGAGGGGGEYAAEPALAMTAGSSYALVIGAGGASNAGGASSTIAGNSVTVTAHGGSVSASDTVGGTGGTGSTNTTHFNGGNGGRDGTTGGGGGGGSAGPANAGNPGADGSTVTGGAGATAVTGGGPGGAGGNAGVAGSAPVSGPGGGGGGAGYTSTTNGAGYAGQIRITFAESASGSIAARRIVFTASGITAAHFPASLLGVSVQILINGAWTDISGYVYQRADIAITRGKPDETATATPCEMTLVLNNRDGRFSLGNPSGAYYPFLVRNTQIRVSVTAASSSGNAYSGYRFWGEVPAWPPAWDPTARDIWVTVTAAGVLRRWQQGAAIGSALRNYVKNLSGSAAPVALWTCEDGSKATSFASVLSAGTAMTWTGTPALAADSASFPGADPLPQLNGSAWTGPVSGSLSEVSPMTYVTPGTYQWTAPGGVISVQAECWGGGGGSSGAALGGAGGGEYAEESSLGVTPGNVYPLTVGGGGAAGSGATGVGGPGGSSTMVGDSVTVTAHGGSGTPYIFSHAYGGAAGTGSSNTIHHNGGNGGTGTNGSGGTGAGGGGGSGGTSTAGNTGGSASGSTGGTAAAAVTGGGPGGAGGGSDTAGSTPASGPGGGAGASGSGPDHPSGVSGYAGQVKLTWSGGTPSANVLRFLVSVPAAGGTNTAIYARMTGTGTIARVDVLYGTGGKLQIIGYNAALTQLFASGYITANLNGAPMAVSVELTPNGTGVNWALKTCVPGSSAVTTIASGTQASATLGAATDAYINVSGTETTAVTIGFPLIQYAVTSLIDLAYAATGYNGEYALARFVRLCNQQSIGYEIAPYSWDSYTAALNPSAWWKLADTAGATSAADSSGGGFTAAATSVTFGNNSQVAAGDTTASFGGASSLLSAYNPSVLAAVTVEAWVNLNGNAPSGNPRIIANSHTDVDNKGFQLMLSGGNTPQVHFGNGSASGNVLSGTAIPGTGWVYLAATWDGTTITLYVNGVSVGTAALAGTLPAGIASGTGIGYNPAYNGDYFTGFIAQCAISEYVLTAAQIAQKYGSSVPCTPRMGVQADDTLLNLFQSIEDADRGQVYESRNLFGLGYRTRVSMQNQAAAVTYDYSLKHLAQQFQPVADDLFLRNDVTVTRTGGSSARAFLATGAISVQSPPNGVGEYPYTPVADLYADSQLAAITSWLLTLGTVPDYRYPQVTIDLARSAVAALMAATANLDVGSRVVVSSAPSFLTNTTVSQLAWGFAETINARTWIIETNAVPEAPYEGAGLPAW